MKISAKISKENALVWKMLAANKNLATMSTSQLKKAMKELIAQSILIKQVNEQLDTQRKEEISKKVSKQQLKESLKNIIKRNILNEKAF